MTQISDYYWSAMSMFKKATSLFSGEPRGTQSGNRVSLLAPLKGRSLPLEEVPDEVFSQKFMGDGFAIDPSEGRVLAPVDCEVVQVFRTGHAVGLLHSSGLEILIHVGIDTVKLQGEGFSPAVKVGQKLKAGDLILEFDLKGVGSKAKSLITPVVVTNMDKVASIGLKASGPVNFLQELAIVEYK